MSPFTLKDLSGKVSGIYSDEQKRYLKGFGKCPLCETRGAAELIDTEGNVLRKLDWKLSIKPDPDRPVVARCRHCEQTWPIFADKALALPAVEPTIEVVETNQTAERFRVDTMCLDNRGGTTPLRRSVTKSQEWNRTYEISGEESKTTEKKLGLTLPAGTLGVKAERAVKSSYRLTEDEKAVLTDTFDFEVPPNTLREVSFIYKKIWQNGLVRVEENGETREAPFRVAVRLEVDLAQNDRAS
jgi:hypothetical protein